MGVLVAGYMMVRNRCTHRKASHTVRMTKANSCSSTRLPTAVVT